MNHPRKTLASATGLTGAAAVIGNWVGGPSLALGILAGGCIAMGDFWLLARNIGAQAAALEAGGRRPALWLGATIFRMGAVLGLLWLALRSFSPLGVLLGLGCVVIAIILRAASALVLHPANPELEP